MAFLTQEQLDALAQFDTPTICNAIEGFGVRGRTEGFTRPELRMRAAMSDKAMVGYARTGVISARQPAAPAHSAVMEACTVTALPRACASRRSHSAAATPRR